MFSKKPHADVKKSTQKILDSKKDTGTRLKHLRVVLENVDTAEVKAFFEANYTHIYYIFYDQFIITEANIKQRAHKTHKEDLDSVIYLFEKILTYLPELLAKRWQCHSIGRIMKKMLHPGNSLKLRRDAVKLFLLWYQSLGESAPDELHHIFSCLVPGLQSQHTLERIIEGGVGSQAQNGEQVPVVPVEISPLLLPQSGEKQVDDLTRFFLQDLLSFMVTQVTKVEWREKTFCRQQRCFLFLFERFKKYYLNLIFPDFSWNTNLYKPALDLPELRTSEDDVVDGCANKKDFDWYKVVVIRWVANFTLHAKKCEPVHSSSMGPVEDNVSLANDVKSAISPVHDPPLPGIVNSNNIVSGSLQEKEPNTSFNSSEDHTATEHAIVKETLYCSRENVNFVHEIFRQAFLLSFSHASAMKRVIAVYKDWIDNKVSERPAFMIEPFDGVLIPREESALGSTLSVDTTLTNDTVDYAGFQREGTHLRGSRLRNDSYLGAIYRDHVNVRAGLQNTLQVFITNAANVFLLENKTNNPELLADQVDMCKRVLNIYRYMVMNIAMDQKTWEQLLLALLQITSLILKETPPLRKEETIGGQLASALFQTLIVTWIKANLNVVISTELWDQFLLVLSSLTQWEELIREWAKTLDTLTRVLAKHVYGLDLQDLPLDRLSEQKQKKRRGRLNPSDTRSTFARSWSRHGSEPIVKTRREDVALATNIPQQSSSARMNSTAPFPTNSIFYTSEITPITVSRHHDRTRSSSGEHSKRYRRSSSERSTSIPRSISEGNIASKAHNPQHVSSRESPDRLPNFTAIPLSMEQEVERLRASFDECLKRPSPRERSSLRRRSKSMESLRFGRTSSTPSCMSDSSGDCRSRTPSPSPSSGLESNSIKDSPMQIDVIGGENSCSLADIHDGNREEHRSVMAGGNTRGWLPDVAVVLWRRMLGALRDVNEIKDPEIHAQVFEYLIELFETLVKIRENQGVTSDNQSTPLPPELIPPLSLIAPWLFKAIILSDKYHKGKLLAYRLLCSMTVRRQDIPLSRDHMIHFYRVLHQGLVGTNQDTINTIVKYCGPQFFSHNIPGSTMLLLDFIYAADTIASSTELKGVPRTEAVSILGSLLCFPNLYHQMQVLQPNAAEFTLMTCKDAVDHIISVILKAGKREPAGLARCIAISSLGLYLYEEIVHCTYHNKMKDAINVLLTALRFNNKIVGQVASDMLLLLCDHSYALLEHFPDVPRRIIEVLANTIGNLLPSSDALSTLEDGKLLISMMFCLGEWCMRVPQSLLIKTTTAQQEMKPLLFSVFKVFNTVVSGKWNSASQSNENVMEVMGPEYDPNIHLDNLRDGTSSTPSSPKSQAMSPMQDLVPLLEASPPRSASSSPTAEGKKEWNVVKLAARTIMSHLVNHLNHFPMGIGAVRLTSMVNEHDDIPGLNAADELSTEIFHAQNVQFFVLNNNTLISFVELPSLDVPGGGVTAGLTTAKSQVRVITRDMSGKFSWDSSILYGPPEYKASSSSESPSVWFSPPIQTQTSSSQKHDDAIPCRLLLVASSSSPPRHTLRHRPPDVLPIAQDTADDMDNVDDLLQYIGHTSPECLDKPGLPLNRPAFTPVSLNSEIEDDTITTVLNQRNYELDFNQRHNSDANVSARPMQPKPPCETNSHFQHSRLLLDQLGFMSWEKRSQFDLLKKNEKLLRELRNLDNQKCRETHKIAIFYVAEGQEDKNSVLSNSGGSQAYEEFVAGLAWEVELETHTGFMGGLQKNKSTGDTAPYYATSFMEVVFHVATRMPTNNEESKLQKTRHLGNDEVHIVWSEHYRDYRRNIIATDFCDALIVIYPLPNKLYRIQINRKPGVPYFGPLFSGSIVDYKVLPGLVRATAINASRAKRSTLHYYQNFYEERAKALETIVQNHKDSSTFEAFTANVFAPAQPKSFHYGSSRALGSSLNSEPSRKHSDFNLAEALIDSHTSNTNSPPLRTRPMSLSASEHPSPRDLHSRAVELNFCDELDVFGLDGSEEESSRAVLRRQSSLRMDAAGGDCTPHSLESTLLHTYFK